MPRETRTGSARPDLPLAVVVSAGGIGAVVARRLGQRNRLLLVDNNREVLNRTMGALQSDGFDVASCLCDITDADAVAALATRAKEAGPLHILAHVAGLSPNGADWRSIMRVNLQGPALVSRAFLGLAIPGTAALFVSSTAAYSPPEPNTEMWAALNDPLAPEFLDRVEAAQPDMSGILAYLHSKRALNRMVRAKAVEWAERGARIVTVSPGPIASPMGAFENQKSPQKAKNLERMPLRREGTMQEVADAVEYLTSERASFITGSDLLLDGGMIAVSKSDT